MSDIDYLSLCEPQIRPVMVGHLHKFWASMAQAHLVGGIDYSCVMDFLCLKRVALELDFGSTLNLY